MGSGKRSDYFREEEDDRPPSFAQIPTSFGQELRACLRCRLVKTYDQVLFRVPSRAQTLYACLINVFFICWLLLYWSRLIYFDSVQGIRLWELPLFGDGEGAWQRCQLYDSQLHGVSRMLSYHSCILFYPANIYTWCLLNNSLKSTNTICTYSRRHLIIWSQIYEISTPLCFMQECQMNHMRCINLLPLIRSTFYSTL